MAKDNISNMCLKNLNEPRLNINVLLTNMPDQSKISLNEYIKALSLLIKEIPTQMVCSQTKTFTQTILNDILSFLSARSGSLKRFNSGLILFTIVTLINGTLLNYLC